MKIGITHKLFLAIFITCMVVVLAMHWAIRYSFDQGFMGYIRHSGENRVTLIADAVSEQYEEYGDWRFITDRQYQRYFFRLLRSIEQDAEHTSGSMPHGWRMQLWIFDDNMQKLFGHGNTLPKATYRRPIVNNGKTVGWVIMSATDKLSRDADINFARQQNLTSWIVSGFVLFVVLIVTLFLARSFLRPTKRLVEGTDQLTAGNYNVRVPVTGSDEIAQLAINFNQLASTLEKNEQMRRDYMADISHELRTPLAILRGELEALQDGVRQSSPETLASLLAEIKTLTKLVDDLHQLSLSDRGALAYRMESCCLTELIQLVLAANQRRITEKQLHVTLSLPKTLPIFADPARLSQLFHNLLENSLRYTDDDGELNITVTQTPDQTTLLWQDSKPGLTEEQCQHIFDRFYRSEASRNRAHGGSGLGLAICDNIVEAHSGKIYASPSALGGVCIHIELPNKTQQQEN